MADPQLARRLGENGRRRVERQLNWERVGERLESYLKEVCIGKRVVHIRQLLRVLKTGGK